MHQMPRMGLCGEAERRLRGVLFRWFVEAKHTKEVWVGGLGCSISSYLGTQEKESDDVVY